MDLEIIQLINFQQWFSVHCVLQWKHRLFHLKRAQKEEKELRKPITQEKSSFQIINEQEAQN